MSTPKRRSGSLDKTNLKKIELGMTEEDWDFFDALYEPAEPIRRPRRRWSDEEDDNA